MFNGSNTQTLLKKIVITSVVPCSVLVLWEVLAGILEKPLILPHIGSVLTILIHPFDNVLKTGSLLNNTVVSMLRVLFGFFIASFIAVPLGLLIGYSRSVRKAMNPLVECLRPIPPLAWVPLALAWFGITTVSELVGVRNAGFFVGNLHVSMIFIIFLGVFFPVLLNTIAGTRNVPDILVESALMLGATQRDALFKVVIPASIPSILIGMKIGMGIGWMCLVAAEMLPGSTAGLGYLISYGYDLARLDVVIAGMIVIGIIGGILSLALGVIEKEVCVGPSDRGYGL